MADADRLLELVHGDLDGSLTPAEKAELARLLLSDPALRRLHDELSRTERLLRTVPQADPPPGLRSAILTALGLPDHHRGGGRVADGGVGYRLAAAVVAGLVVVGLGYGLLGERSDTRGLQGSVAAGATPAATLQAGSGQVAVRLEETAAHGTRLVLQPGPGAAGELVLRFDAAGIDCRTGDASGGLSSPAAGEWVLTLPAAAAQAALDCTGNGDVRLETRAGGTVQESATVTLGP